MHVAEQDINGKNKLHIAVLCATRRGYLFIRRLTDLLPQANLTVFSFREDPVEPPFIDDIRKHAVASRAQFFETKQIGSRRWVQFWNTNEVDLMFVVSWRYLIPAHVYKRPSLGTYVFHDSLLPEYRGFAPTVWAIINGEAHTGVTLFEIAEGVDEGDIVAQERVQIGPDETIATVMGHVTETYLRLLEQNLDNLLRGTAQSYPQDHSRATYTTKRLPEDNQIDWTAPSSTIHNLIRGATKPYPGAFTCLLGQKLRVWSSRRLLNPRRYVGGIPGRVVEIYPGEGTAVLTGDGPLLLKEVQIENHKPKCAADVLNKYIYTLGDCS